MKKFYHSKIIYDHKEINAVNEVLKIIVHSYLWKKCKKFIKIS